MDPASRAGESPAGPPKEVAEASFHDGAKEGNPVFGLSPSLQSNQSSIEQTLGCSEKGGHAREPAAAQPRRPAQLSGQSNAEVSPADGDGLVSLKRKFDDLSTRMEVLERQVADIQRVRANARRSRTQAAKAALEEARQGGRGSSPGQPKYLKSYKEDKGRTKAAREKRMADLFRHCANVLRTITSHKWAWPFMKPVDIVTLGLSDYYDIVKRPMDLGTIRDRLDGKLDPRYSHPQEVCDDTHLVFDNARLYNPAGSDVYTMAQALDEKFTEKWDAVMAPRLADEEVRRQQDEIDDRNREAAAQQAAEEVMAEKLARDVGKQLDDVDCQLEDVKRQAAEQCRPMTVEEKRQLGYDLGLLPPEHLNEVIQIISEKDPKYNANSEEVEVDLDAQEPATLWRLRHYARGVLVAKTDGSPVGALRKGGAAADQARMQANRKAR